jgi:NDP-sugar pyrophosphorylase family protein
VHNVDVISTIDLARMVQYHTENRALATLAVQNRETSRSLLFDERNQLCSRRSGTSQTDELGHPSREVQALAFSGIHAISPRFLEMLTEAGAFSIIASYLRLAAQGEKILAFQANEFSWRDLGKPENLAQAERDLKKTTSM